MYSNDITGPSSPASSSIPLFAHYYQPILNHMLFLHSASYLLGYCHLVPANLFFLVLLSFTPGSIKSFLFLAEHAIFQCQIL